MMRDKLVSVHSFPVWLPQTQTWMYTQVKCLPKEIEVHIVCEETENLDQFTVPNIHSLQDISAIHFLLEKWLRKLRLRYLLGYLSSMTEETNAHLIHSHFGHIGWTNLVAARKNHVKHVVTFYGADVNKLPVQDKNWVDRYQELFDKADLFLCEGPHMAGKLVDMGCPRQKILIHHLGIEIEKVPYMPRRWSKGEPFRVLIAGAFREKKGIPYALKALENLKNALPLEISILGDAGPEQSSRTEKRHILRTLEQTGLASQTRLLGFQPHSVFFEEAYKHHVLISPSISASDGDTEGGAPVSIIEGIATGMPVISTLHCDIPEVIQYDRKGWLVEERDVQGLIEKLEWLVEHSDEWNELLVPGRQHVEANFNARQQGGRLAEIYEKALSL